MRVSTPPPPGTCGISRLTSYLMRQDITNREEIVSFLGPLYNVHVWSEVLITVCKKFIIP